MQMQLVNCYLLASCVAINTFWLTEAVIGQEVDDEARPVKTAPPPQAAKTPIDPEQRKKDFEQRDKDKDGQLTLTEHLGQRQGAARASARDNFFRSDLNGDDLLSLNEFLSRDASKQQSPHSLFRLHDIDDNGQLT